jgi:dipeptidyl aminopeptidase/acylaminoacyl peptidase
MRKQLAFLICVLVTVVAHGKDDQPTTSKLLPLEQFTKFDSLGEARISPDGAYLAIATGKDGRSIIEFIRLSDGKVTGGARCPDEYELSNFEWVSPRRMVYSLAEYAPGRATPMSTGLMFAIDSDGSGQRPIYGYRAGRTQTGTRLGGRDASYASATIISTLDHDDNHILIAEYPWRQVAGYFYADPNTKPIVYSLDVYSGEKKKIDYVPLAQPSILLDGNDKLRFALGSDDRGRQSVIWRRDPGGEWQVFTLPGFIEGTVVPRLFGADNETAFVTGVRAGEHSIGLYRLDLKSGAALRISRPDDDDVTNLVYDFSGRSIVGSFTYEDKPAYEWFDPSDKSAKVYRSLLKAFPDQSVRIATATLDGKLAVAFVQSDVNPGDYYLFDTEKMTAKYLLSSRMWVDPKTMLTKEGVDFTARDGLKIHAYVTRPLGNGPFPMIVLPHGGPHQVRDYWGYDPEAQLFASRGYAVLQVNFRGSGGYGADFEHAGYRQWGAAMQDDITDATRWAIAEKIADPERICIYGTSYGAYAALMGIEREPTLYKCAVGYAGVYDLELMYTTADVPTSVSGRAYLERVIGTDPADLHLRSPVYNAQAIQVPVLLIHGTDDWRADFDQAKRMKAALEKNGKKFEFLALRGEGHGAYSEETRLQVYQRIVDFIDRNLQGAASEGSVKAH